MRYAVGIDLGGTDIKYGVVDSTGTPYFESAQPSRALSDHYSVLDSMSSAIKKALDIAIHNNILIEGIGIAVPGIIVQGLVLACGGNLPEIEGMALATYFQDQFHVPVKLGNDADLMALAECQYGSGRGLKDLIFLTIGTGVGGALVVDGVLYKGNQHRGGELGHLSVDLNGALCTCGRRGCLEAVASVTALVKRYSTLRKTKAHTKGVDGRQILAAYRQGEEAACAVMEEHFFYLGQGIASLINIFSPQKVIIGGGISEAGEEYINPIRIKSLELAMKETSLFTRIEGAYLGNKAGFVGAAGLFLTEDRSEANGRS